MQTIETHGARANSSGREFKLRVLHTLELRGFVYSEQVDRDKVILTGQRYQNIYGTTTRHDIIIATRSGFRMAIDLSWQGVPGSVDRKIPFDYLNAVQCSPEQNILLVFDGTGQNPAAVDWIKQQAERRWLLPPASAKTICVYDSSTQLFDLIRTL